MMLRERPRALCARALARFSHVPGAAGRDRGACVLTGGAKRTRRREDPTEPECGDVRTDLSQWWHSRTNPSARGYPNELAAHGGSSPERTRRVGDQTNPSAWRSERTRAARSRTNPSDAAVRRTRANQSRTNPSGVKSERTRAARRPNEPKRRAQSDELDLQPSCTNEPKRVEIQTNRSRAQPNEPERRGSSGREASGRR